MRWNIADIDASTVRRLEDGLGITPFLASLLTARGYSDVQQVSALLNPVLSNFPNPLELPGMEAAANRVVTAIKERQRVVIYGDYDVDGVTSISLLMTFLADVGLSATYIVPSRFVDGYGLNMERARQIADDGYALVITVDCGSASALEVAYLEERGVDVIVTDHHKIHGDRPQGVAFLNPQDWEDVQLEMLAGVGVAFLLVSAVYIKLKKEATSEQPLPTLKSYLDLVTIGTVADMVPLEGPNRALVVNGLRQIQDTPCRPGVIALKEVAGVHDRKMDSSSIAFYMAPRINAAGRLGHAETAVDLLLSTDFGTARVKARQLDDDNRKRRELEQQIFAEADQLLEAGGMKQLNAIVLGSPHWHQGVLGIVASRICERYFRPTILMSIKDGVAVGSARSIAGFDIASALEANQTMLQRYGGHPMAAGLTMDADKMDDLRLALDKAVGEALPPGDLDPAVNVDVVVPLSEVTNRTISDLEKLAPFGAGNPEPVIGCRAVRVIWKRLVGGGDHLKLRVEQEGRSLEAIGYRMGKSEVKVGDVVDVAFHPEIRTWQGVSTLQLRLKDLETPSK